MGDALEIFAIMMAIFVPIMLLNVVLDFSKHRKNTRKQLAAMQDQLLEANNTELEQEIAKLKERVAALESIVTDQRYDLDRKIANL